MTNMAAATNTMYETAFLSADVVTWITNLLLPVLYHERHFFLLMLWLDYQLCS